MKKKFWHNTLHVLAIVAALGSLPLTGVLAPAIAAKVIVAAGVANIVLGQVKKAEPEEKE